MHKELKANIVTPWNKDGDRLHLVVSPEDAAKVKRGCRWQATVGDLHTGFMYVLRDASCGSRGCHCAARVIRRFAR